jgi:branched-subunit amino acid aminotransferase/4-amino-4-deoxychorismate lyase
MTAQPAPRIEVDGRPAAVESLLPTALNAYWHFTAMQVRGRRLRGLDLHLRRLGDATDEIFGMRLDTARVRDFVRHALAGDADAAVRVYVYRPDGADDVSVMVTVRPPIEMPSGAQRLMSVPYQRPFAHLKHGGGFAQGFHTRLAERRGFDEILLTAPDGTIAEGGVTNIGFFDGSDVVWPEAPQLAGITMQLLEPRLADAGLPSVRRRVTLADLPSFRAAFVTNSRGIAPVSGIDETVFGIDGDLVKTLAEVYDDTPWDVI